MNYQNKNFIEEKVRKNKSQQLVILDLTETHGVNYFLKEALFSEIRKQSDDLTVKNAVPVSIVRMNFLFLVFSICNDVGSFIKDVARSCSISSKLMFTDVASRENILRCCIDVEYDGLNIGECILSSYFRNINSPIIPKKSLSLIIFYFAALINVGFQIRQLSKSINLFKNSQLLFYNLETTGWHEIWRRYLISKGVGEIRYSNFHRGFKIFYGFRGEDLRKSAQFREMIYDSLSLDQIMMGKSEIKQLIDRKKTYAYLKSFDVDCSKRIKAEIMKPKDAVIIFLSTISDAQYSYGVGPYLDLMSFQEEILEASLNKGFKVVVKPHPNMFKEKDYTAKDRRYFEYLKEKWKVKNWVEGLEISGVNPKIYFAHHSISAVELARVFPNFMCVTQHGTVAAECAQLNIFAMVGNNSRYCKSDKFVRIMHSKSEICSIFREWQAFTGFNEDEREALFKFSYLNNIGCRPLYANVIFEGCMPNDVDSWKAEAWLGDFIKIKENREMATHSSREFVRSAGVELEKYYRLTRR